MRQDGTSSERGVLWRGPHARPHKVRPLVRGYLERISVKAFEKHHREITDLVQSQHGVYALYKNARLYYVGLAVDLRRRIKQHVRDKHGGRWDRFSLYLVRRVDHIKEIESLVLRIADPKGNTHAGRLGRAMNLQRKLKRLMAQQQRQEFEEIFSPADRAPRPLRRRSRAESLRRRVGAGRPARQRPLRGIVGGKRIYATYKGTDHVAKVLGNGGIKYAGQIFDTPTAAAKAITHGSIDGWLFWRVRVNGELVKLSDLRDRGTKPG